MNVITKPRKVNLTPGKNRTKTTIQRGFWTPEKDADLRCLRAKNWTMLEIATKFGVTKNSVCGRASRLGLSSPDNSPIKADPGKVAAARKRTAERKKLKAEANRRHDLAHPDDQPKVVNGCRFIAIDPKKRPADMSIEDMHCNAPLQKGSSYCAHHHERCCMEAPKREKKPSYLHTGSYRRAER